MKVGDVDASFSKQVRINDSPKVVEFEQRMPVKFSSMGATDKDLANVYQDDETTLSIIEKKSRYEDRSKSALGMVSSGILKGVNKANWIKSINASTAGNNKRKRNFVRSHLPTPH